jgi:positive regulator of sigma E activity
MMKLQLTKNDFRKMIIACNESTSCFSCAFRNFCTEADVDKGEFIANIAEIMPDAEVE